ncbi:MAG: DUF2170 family protein [Ghiorsea sp.]|nr:DUF2170 family protein [Ghiorsea sp.]
MLNLKTLASELAERGQDAEKDFLFTVNAIPGEVEVLQILVEDREELPIFISTSDDQVLCIAYLFKNEEVKADMVHEMNNAMLSANISIPLSSFAKIGDQYVIYGALSVSSNLDDVVHEIDVLASNMVEAIEVMSDFLK